MNKQFLEKLINADGVPGNEGQVYEVLKTELESSVDEITKDNIGSFISIKKNSGAPKVLLAGHMDEVGFMVKRITDEGFIKFATLGGWYDQVLLGQRLKITTREGKTYTGVIGSKPPHILPAEKRSEVVKIEDMYIDVCADSKEEVEKMGIVIGDMITPESNFTEMPNEKYYLGKAFDNRIGCYVMAEVMKNVKDKQLNCELYGAATVQEEVGLRGARTLAYKVNPDVAITLDTGIAGGTPGVTADEADAKLGDGAQLLVLDGSGISNKNLRYYLFDLAKELEVDIVPQILKQGGTDNGQIHLSRDGVIGLSFAISTRYLHTHTSIIHRDDVEGLVKLITEFVLRFDEDVYNKLKGTDEK